MQIIIAEMRHLDLSAKVLAEVYFKSFDEAKKYAMNRIKSKECIVAVDCDEVFGVLTYKKEYSHDANYIDNIVVAKKHRRKGIATLLIKKCIVKSKKEQPKEQKYVLSSTDITNKASIKMHLSLGFKKLGKIKGLHYGKDEIFFGYCVC